MVAWLARIEGVCSFLPASNSGGGTGQRTYSHKEKSDGPNRNGADGGSDMSNTEAIDEAAKGARADARQLESGSAMSKSGSLGCGLLSARPTVLTIATRNGQGNSSASPSAKVG